MKGGNDMNWKKTGVLGILALIMLPLFLTAVQAYTGELAVKWAVDQVTPTGAVDAVNKDIAGFGPTAIILGILALILIFVILLDVADLVLPFGAWTNRIIVAALTIAGLAMGVVKSIAGWGLALGALITGAAGVFAIVVSSLLLAAGVIALIWGGNKLTQFATRAKGNRKVMEAAAKAYDVGAKIRGERMAEKIGAGIKAEK
jgi:hypothetical protein